MNDFERVKSGVDIQQVVISETKLVMKGKHLEECPFCGGHECFSFKNKETFNCFQCPAGGDVFNFYEMKHIGITRGEALKMAAEFAGVELPKIKQKNMSMAVKERIFLCAAEYYHGLMLKDGGREYFINKRGHSEDVLKDMKVGWSDGGFVDHCRGKNFSDEDILKSGLAKKRKSNGSGEFLGDFFFKGMAVFPHFENSRVLHFTMKDPAKKYTFQLANTVRAGEWRFYNQGALAKFREIIVVEGENDVLSVMGTGAKNVIGLIGQPSVLQIRALKTQCVNKHIYLWMDGDEGGRKYVRQICTALKGGSYNVKVVVFPGEFNDPDVFIQKFEGDRRKEIKRLQEEAVDYVEWEVIQAGKIEGLDRRLDALKEFKVFEAVSEMVEVQKLIYIEKIEGLGFSRRSVEELLEVNQELAMEVRAYFDKLPNRRDADPNELAVMIYDYFTRKGKFFFDIFDKVYLQFRRKSYEVNVNRAFNALLRKNTGLLPTKEPGRSVWEALASEGYTRGIQITLAAWKKTDRETDTVYLNLNSPNNIILKISKKEIEEIENGLNEDNVLLQSSSDIMPFTYLPDVNVREGFKVLKELVFDNMTCDVEQKYLIICWMISGFLLDFTPYYGLMKFSGATASGKTTAATFISILMYGNEHFGDPTTASAYAVASQNPLLIIDNLESDDLTKNMLKFLLLTASKKGKIKRTKGTESATTKENPTALVLVTAIEPFLKPELINRTYDIEFLKKHRNDRFVLDEVVGGLIKKRNVILSSVLKVIQKNILPELAQRKDYMVILKKEYKGHSKDRTDEYLSLLMLILNKIINFMPVYGEDHVLFGYETGEKDVRKAWIEYQNAKAKETETTSNSIIKLLDGLVREYMSKMKDVDAEPKTGYDGDVFCFEHPDYLVEFIKTKPEMKEDESGEPYSVSYVEFISTSREISLVFDRFCKNNGIKNPYTSASVFSSRLKNDSHLLKQGGWELVSREGFEPYYTRVRGERFWKFRKTLIK